MPNSSTVVSAGLVTPEIVKEGLRAFTAYIRTHPRSSSALPQSIELRNQEAMKAALFAVEEMRAALASEASSGPVFFVSSREHAVLGLLASGMMCKEIASQLDLSTSTVRAHLHNIYGKLGVDNRAQAAMLFMQHRVRAENVKSIRAAA